MRKRTVAIAVIVFLLFAGALGAYIAIGTYYQTHFFEKTSINGIDVSDLTAEEAENLIADQAEDYRVTLTTKEGAAQTIEGSDIGYQFVSQGEVQGFLEEQNFLAWLPAYFGSGKQYTMEASMTYDQEKLAGAIAALDCMQAENVTAPQDAYLTQQEDGTYVIVPETEGNTLDAGKVEELLAAAVESGGTEIDLAAEDCYLKPDVYQDDGALKAEAAIRNRYSSITITYQMGGGVTETLDKETVASWFSLDENLQPSIDRDAVAAWVNQLADQYDTIGSFLPFVTSNGETVYPESRTYGWQMDREAETEELYQLLLKGDSAERSPVWLESAAARGENDIGDTYIEIDYTNQRMWYYKDGQLLVETPVVTGNVNAGMASPEGVFCIVGKEEDAVLTGEDYKTPVDYWMPFYEGVGIHDADTWRTAYGGDIYLWSGSHGCINTPTAQAAVIFQNVEVGTPVVCYSSGTDYGYGQTGSGSTGTGNTGTESSDADIVIIDGNSDSGTQNGQSTPETSGTEEDWADESTYYELNGETQQTEFPIVIQDEWSSQSGEQVIY
ncbi:MAG TPA: peptidoglycan binding domain-containing protein [Candidatus Choladousia intestinipullorum]|nr:peptidoglycan binding domain-containing protein [Candidatus Choladousia intestinipullorum]